MIKELYIDKIICGKKDKWLELSKLKIKSLPENFRCYGSLSCDGSFFYELPNSLIIEGNLYIGSSNILQLPDNLIIGGDLVLLGSKITTLPNDICVCGKIISISIKNFPKYKKNKIYKNCVCDKNGQVVPYKSIIDYSSKEKIKFFLGYFEEKNAIVYYDDVNIQIFTCSSFFEGQYMIEKYKLKCSLVYQKYLDYDINKKYFSKELENIFKDITNTQKKKYYDLPLLAKYSIKEFCELLIMIAPEELETRLFCDYFLHREVFVDF